MTMSPEDFKEPIELAFLDVPDNDAVEKLNIVQQFVYTEVRLKRNEERIKHLNEVISLKMELIELRKEVREKLEELKGA